MAALFLAAGLCGAFWKGLQGQQVFGVSILLLSVAVGVYVLDFPIRLVGLVDDRLQLLAPASRWRVLSINMMTVCSFALFGYGVGYLPYAISMRATGLAIVLELGQKAVSLLTGSGLMILIILALKPLVVERNTLRGLCWGLFIVTQAAILVAGAKFAEGVASVLSWILGAGGGADITSCYYGIVQIFFIGAKDQVYLQTISLLCNLFLGLAAWFFAWSLAQRKHNYLKV
ncbi:hypothetical protein [Austwickia chelonae]|uniref:hypothetical protein n=1 Tax=Austwickia chelonae TaxID=100225 RepID=UPI00138AD242|nr:hypothetical protein [Austwickia chelonae]